MTCMVHRIHPWLVTYGLLGYIFKQSGNFISMVSRLTVEQVELSQHSLSIFAAFIFESVGLVSLARSQVKFLMAQSKWHYYHLILNFFLSSKIMRCYAWFSCKYVHLQLYNLLAVTEHYPYHLQVLRGPYLTFNYCLS